MTYFSYLIKNNTYSRRGLDMQKKTDKRTRLVEAADKLFYEQGVSITTLANIASLAEVPLGNVYYYFKSKDSIIQAVIEQRQRMLRDQFAQWATLSPAEQLKALIQQQVDQNAQTLAFGDWFGSLCQELCKAKGPIASSAAELMNTLLNWAEKQFQGMAKGEQSKALALALMASLQGLSLLTLTLKDESLSAAQAQRLINAL